MLVCQIELPSNLSAPTWLSDLLIAAAAVTAITVLMKPVLKAARTIIEWHDEHESLLTGQQELRHDVNDIKSDVSDIKANIYGNNGTSLMGKVDTLSVQVHDLSTDLKVHAKNNHDRFSMIEQKLWSSPPKERKRIGKSALDKMAETQGD